MMSAFWYHRRHIDPNPSLQILIILIKVLFCNCCKLQLDLVISTILPLINARYEVQIFQINFLCHKKTRSWKSPKISEDALLDKSLKAERSKSHHKNCHRKFLHKCDHPKLVGHHFLFFREAICCNLWKNYRLYGESSSLPLCTKQLWCSFCSSNNNNRHF